ncbi:MAG: translation initiation factor IF-2 [Acidobacteria bacterium]|nr:translation initiation factor IF-2 [Acidobacteriota bacterium]
MGKIRINDLARELEVKSRAIIEYLPEIGITDKRSHSSALEDDEAEKVRAHFLGEAQVEAPEKPQEAAPASVEPAPAAPPEKKEFHIPLGEAKPMTRSLAQIKAEARKAVLHPPVQPPPTARPADKPAAVGVPPAAGPATAPFRPTAIRPGAVPAIPPKTGVPVVEAKAAGSPAKAGATATATPGKSIRPLKPAKKDPSASQPIYPPAAATKGAPVRPPLGRRPGEPRPMHPTATRPPGGTAALRPSAHQARTATPRGPVLQRAPVSHPRPVALEEIPITRKITITEGVSIKELSEKLEARAKDVIKRLLDKGIFATINQTLDSQTATEVSRYFGADASVITYEEEVTSEVEEADRPEDLVPRAPVVTVMGHVDHGKTSLLDAIRETSVAAREAGGITQHIGAYQIEAQGRKIVFLDTPGHEAFTMMRARGSKATDVVVLVVAADDGVMPQTMEAINHARAAKVPIVVAINKIDKADAQPERVKRQLSDQNLMPEDWGGQTVTVEVSAKQRKNLSLLLEMILLVADLQQLKANPKRPGTGTVLEAKLDRGRGPVATVLIQNGTLHVGDAFIIGSIYGKVRAMFDDRGRPVIEAPPATPVEVLGLEDVPQAGDKILVIEDTAKARQIALHRQAKLRDAALAKSARLTLEQLHARMAAGDVKELALIIKADVQGSVEVLVDTLNKLSMEKVKVKVIHAGVGAITETDVLLASASNAVIIGFSVRPERKASEIAQLERVDIRLHTIIYNVTDEIKKAMTGLLAAVVKETTLGHAAVRDTFRISKVGTVAGCRVEDGKITREAKIRLVRDSVVVYEGKVRSLRHFKEDVSEVRNGMECGIGLENFNDVKVGDVIEAYVLEKMTEPALV